MNNIILIGLNHKTAPVDLRECLAFTEDQTRSALVRLRAHPAIAEALLLSTCNRVELLLTAHDIDTAVAAAKQLLVDNKQVPLNQFESALYLYQGEDAVRHLFTVTASLDSMVLGEPQILGQVKTAYRYATEEKSSGVVLNRLLHRAFYIAKRIRSETGIGDHAVSVSYAAIELGRKIFGDLKDKQVMLIGAGEMAELAVEHLISHHVGQVYLANRTFERGLALASRYNGSAIAFEEIPAHLSRVDIIISSTGAQDYVISKSNVKGMMRERRNRPLFFIDIAVPRNIDPQLNQLNNVFVYDIDDLNEVVEDNRRDRHREALKAQRMVAEATIAFRLWHANLDVVPTVKALREKISALGLAELKKTAGQLSHLSPHDFEIIEKIIQTTINKILHEPTCYLKSNGMRSANRSQAIDMVRKLFNLDERNDPGNLGDLGDLGDLDDPDDRNECSKE